MSCEHHGCGGSVGGCGGAGGGGALTHPTLMPPLPSICPSHNLFSCAAATGITYTHVHSRAPQCPLNQQSNIVHNPMLSHA